MSSLQILQALSTMTEEERKEIIESALECGKSMLRTLDDILTIAKSRNINEFIKVSIYVINIYNNVV